MATKKNEWLWKIPAELQREWFGPGAYKPDPLKDTDPRELSEQIATIVRLCDAAGVVSLAKYADDIGYRVVMASDISE